MPKIASSKSPAWTDSGILPINAATAATAMLCPKAPILHIIAPAQTKTKTPKITAIADI
jgi:hypothetical protein